MRIPASAAVLLLFLTTAAASAQPQPTPTPAGAPQRDVKAPKTGTAVLKGHVVSAETGRPLRRAQVRTGVSDPREMRTVSTDENGAWEFRDLPAGRYTIQVSKGGYVALFYGQRRPFEQGKPVELADGQTIEKLDVSLPSASVITGRIFDEFGEPVSGARVSAARNRFVEAWDGPVQPRATLADVVAHVEHLREAAGIDHVGIGGDYDGTTDLPDELSDVSTYPRLLDALADRGWSAEDLAKLAHRNALRVLRDADA